MEYNTQRESLLLMEYGRNIQKIAYHIKSVESKEKRNSYAKTLVELMKQINPNVKGSADYDQKVWDDLFIMSGFDLDVEAPYPKPEPSILTRKPRRMNYSSNTIKYRHFGRNLGELIETAKKLEDPEEKEGAIVSIGRLMKSFYQTWNKDFIEDEQVLKIIKELSQNELVIDLEKVKEYKLFDSSRREGDYSGGHRNRNKNQSRNKRNKRRRNN